MQLEYYYRETLTFHLCGVHPAAVYQPVLPDAADVDERPEVSDVGHFSGHRGAAPEVAQRGHRVLEQRLLKLCRHNIADLRWSFSCIFLISCALLQKLIYTNTRRYF